MPVGFIFPIVAAFIVYRGIKKCFQTNESYDKKDFFERFYILGFPIAVKLVVVFVLFTLTALIVAYKLQDVHPILSEYMQTAIRAISLIYAFLNFYLLNRSFIRLVGLLRGKEEPINGESQARSER